MLCKFTNKQVENLYKRVNGVISFVSENPVRAVTSHTQTWLSKWYREVSHPQIICQWYFLLTCFFSIQNSLVFVSNSHGIWATPDRRSSKRYGQLVHSPKSDLNEMLDEHKEEVYKWISERADRAEEESDEDSWSLRWIPDRSSAGESVEFPRLCMELCDLLSKNSLFSYPINAMKLSCHLQYLLIFA